MLPPEFYSRKALSQFLKLDRQTVLRRAKKLGIEPVKHGAQTLFHRYDAERIIADTHARRGRIQLRKQKEAQRRAERAPKDPTPEGT